MNTVSPSLAHARAPLGGRALAWLIDGALGLGSLLLAVLLVARSTHIAFVPPGLLFAALIVLGPVAYQASLLASKGQSIGKRAMGLRIVNVADGGNPGFASAVLLRWWLPGLLYVISCPGLLFYLVDTLLGFRQNRRCLHDLLAGTVVVPAAPETACVSRPGVA